MKIVELKQNIFKENEVTADKIRDEFKKQKRKEIDFYTDGSIDERIDNADAS